MSYDVHKQHSFPSKYWLLNDARNDGINVQLKPLTTR